MNSLQLSPNLKSLRSPPAFLYVENRTECTVDIYWIDYSSKLLRLFTLKPSKCTPINTYALHPWIFIDKSTGQLLRVKNQPVLYAKPLQLRRERVFVHLPMRSLQDITLLCLFKHLKNVDVVNELEIPQILKGDLQKVFLLYEEHEQRLRDEPQR